MGLKEVYALEKLHGTSANISFGPDGLKLYPGGLKSEEFEAVLLTKFDSLKDLEFAMNNAMFRHHEALLEATIYGELYGGKCQKMSDIYGPLNFAAFEVKVTPIGREPYWLTVPSANYFTTMAGLEFVHWVRGPATLEWLDAQRDKPSVQARRNGMGEKYGEGIVIRTINEERDRFGERILAKHKAEKYKECRTPRKPDPAKQIRWSGAQKVAREFVVPERLNHVISHLEARGIYPVDKSFTGDVVKETIKDIRAEESDEIDWTPEVSKAIGASAARLFHSYLREQIKDMS